MLFLLVIFHDFYLIVVAKMAKGTYFHLLLIELIRVIDGGIIVVLESGVSKRGCQTLIYD